MEYNILCKPTYSAIEVELKEGEKIVADSGAMTWMTANMECKTQARGGIFAGLKRKLLAGESFFQNTYSPKEGPGHIGIAPGISGAIHPYEMKGGELFLEKGAYLASTEGVECDAKWDGLKGLFNEGFFVLRVTGTGPSFGEGFVMKFKGKGRVLVQSHNPNEFGKGLGPLLPERD